MLLDLKVMNKCGDLIVAKLRLLHVSIFRFGGDQHMRKLERCKMAAAPCALQLQPHVQPPRGTRLNPQQAACPFPCKSRHDIRLNHN